MRQISNEERAKREEFNQKEQQILRDIPVQFHDYFSQLAYKRGHAYGYNEVLNHLEDYICGFMKALKEYDDTKRKCSS